MCLLATMLTAAGLPKYDPVVIKLFSLRHNATLTIFDNYLIIPVSVFPVVREWTYWVCSGVKSDPELMAETT